MRVQKVAGGTFWNGTIQEYPWTLIFAVNEALTVLSWHENLGKDEVPPRHLWWSGELLDEWFLEVEKRRKNKASPKKKTPYDEADDSPMMGNELVERDDQDD